MTDVKFGALCWTQYASWPDLLEAGVWAGTAKPSAATMIRFAPEVRPPAERG